jgi:hypothetical protein
MITEIKIWTWEWKCFCKLELIWNASGLNLWKLCFKFWNLKFDCWETLLLCFVEVVDNLCFFFQISLFTLDLVPRFDIFQNFVWDVNYFRFFCSAFRNETEVKRVVYMKRSWLCDVLTLYRVLYCFVHNRYGWRWQGKVMSGYMLIRDFVGWNLFF